MIRSRLACALILSAAVVVAAQADDNAPRMVTTERMLPINGPWCVAFSPDGKMVAAGGSPDGEIKLWEFPAGRERTTLHHGWHVAAVAFSQDGSTLISAAWEQSGAGHSTSTIKLWNVANAQEGRLLGSHDQTVSALAVSRDGKLLASADDGGRVNLWSIDQKREPLSFQAWNGPIASLAFSPDGKILAVGEGWMPDQEHERESVTFWDPASGKGTRVLEGLRKSKLGAKVAYTPKGDILAIYAVLTIKTWNVVTGKEDGEFPDLHDRVASLEFSPDGSLLAVGGAGGSTGIWDVRTKTRQVILLGSGKPSKVAFSPDGRTLLTTEGGGVQIWDIPKVLQATEGKH